jgi:valyl-tRNA synthetase
MQSEKLNVAAEEEMALLKRFVSACRNLRSEMGLPPSLRRDVEVLANVDGTGLDLERFVTKNFWRIAGLVKADNVRVVAVPSNAEAPVAMVDAMRVMIVVTVDPAAERERIGKEIVRIEREITKVCAKLDDQNFVEKAPAPVVEQMRARLAGFTATLEKLKEQHGRLGS